MLPSRFVIRYVAPAFYLAGLFLMFGCSEPILEPDLPLLEEHQHDSRVISSEFDTLRVYIQAEVTLIDDSNSRLGGRINAGDTARGSYLYDTTCTDSRNHKRIGHYIFDQPPFGMQFVIADLCFNSDSASPDLNIIVKDEVHRQGLHDSYEVGSYNNLDVLPGVVISDMVILLEDNDGGTLSSDALPANEPDLSEWVKTHELRIVGSDGWFIIADISYASTAPYEESQEKKNRTKDNFKMQ